MTREQLRELQILQLKIALEIRRICDKYGINYFLDCGSMLGAVRHNGFIPWDDDMDVGFLRKDYDKFISVARKELGDMFYLLTWDDNVDYPHPYAKICLKDTIYREQIAGSGEKTNNGIFVDLFPYDNISDNKAIRLVNGMVRKLMSHMMMIKCGYRVWEGKGFIKKLKFSPFNICSFFFSKNSLKRLFNRMAYMYQDVETREVGIEDGGISLYWRYRRDNLEEFIESKFEDLYFKIPRDYDVLLRTGYGDYMELPPEETRWIGHAIEKIDFGPYVREKINEEIDNNTCL